MINPADYASITDWRIVALLVLSQAVAALLSHWRMSAKVKEVKTLAEPTGNGFAAVVKDALQRIETDGKATNKLLVEHLVDHAKAA